MYSRKAVYFNYKSFTSVLFLMLFPVTLVLVGGSMGMATLSIYPMLGGIVIALLIASPGLPRLLAINANVDLKQDKIEKALRNSQRACRLPFTPVSVCIFDSYANVLNGRLMEAKDRLESIKDEDMSFPEKSKYRSVKALAEWLETKNAEKGIELLGEFDRNGADESVYYVIGKLMNICKEPSEARKYNAKAMEMHPGNRDIMENLVISYCRTGQEKEAKLLFRNLYYDLKATSDSFCYMAELKINDGKKQDAVEFLEAALEIEEKATNIVSGEMIEGKIREIKEAGI